MIAKILRIYNHIDCIIQRGTSSHLNVLRRGQQMLALSERVRDWAAQRVLICPTKFELKLWVVVRGRQAAGLLTFPARLPIICVMKDEDCQGMKAAKEHVHGRGLPPLDTI